MDNFVSSSSKTPYLIGAAIFGIVVLRLFSLAREDAKIRKLGSRAPIRTNYLPFGLDFAIQLIHHGRTDTMYDWWVNLVNKTCDTNTQTLEAGVGERLIVTSDHENIRAILATQFKDYGKGEQFRKDWYDFLGDGIFAADGQSWHDSRHLIRPQFTKDRVSDLDIFEEHTLNAISKITPGEELDTLNLMFRYTLDAATHFLFGESAGSLDDPGLKFADAFYNVQHVQGMIAKVGPLAPLVPKHPLGFYKSLNLVNEFVSRFIDKALALSPAELEKKSGQHEGYTFLHAIAGYSRDRKMLRDQLVSILLAGRDTTACTLTWALYELSRNPDVVAKLRQDILATVGREQRPTYQNLKDMKYLQHVISETLRLYPAVPYNMRFSLKDTTLPVGGGKDGRQPIGILKGTPIVYSTLVMQRRPDLYPSPESGFPAVDKFVPERWESWHPEAWTYVPFNGGPRICIGQQFALTEMGYTLVKLFQKFERVENRMNGVEAKLHADIVLQPGNEIKIAFF